MYLRHVCTCARTRVQGCLHGQAPASPPVVDSVVPMLEAMECGDMWAAWCPLSPQAVGMHLLTAHVLFWKEKGE